MTHPGILVVDDEKNIRLTMIQDLAPLGYELSCAMNGEDAFKQLEEKEFGLILLLTNHLKSIHWLGLD